MKYCCHDFNASQKYVSLPFSSPRSELLWTMSCMREQSRLTTLSCLRALPKETGAAIILETTTQRLQRWILKEISYGDTRYCSALGEAVGQGIPGRFRVVEGSLHYEVVKT